MNFSETDFAFPDEQYNALIRIVKRRTGMDLRGYREGVARRRVARRARDMNCGDISSYLQYLMKHRDEAQILVRLITIKVSRFFRNPEVFDLLARMVLPEIFERKRSGEGVIAWSAGCAEGEEAYSVAILLLKHCGGFLHEHPPRIVGTDVNEQSIAAARRGRYKDDKVAPMDDSLKKRYFRYRNGFWEVRPGLRGLVEFSLENLFSGPGVVGSDIILARNLLIYFDKVRQQALLDKLVDCLNPGGYLVLGKSETLPHAFREKFCPMVPNERVYRKTCPPSGRVEGH